VYLSNKTTPAQVRDAWRAWWRASAARVDLAKLSAAPPYHGFTLISLQTLTKVVNGNVVAGSGKLLELRPDRAVHWEFANLNYPIDARVIGPNRVLVAEYLGRRVTERDFAGNILWEIPQTMPIACERLPGGDTFIATRSQLVIVDPDKKTVFSYFHQNGSISAATRLRDGHIVFVASTGQCHWLDPQGKEIKQFQVGYIYPTGGSIEVLPNRHVLVPLYRDGKVAEFDADGKMVWHVSISTPVSAARLPNGHTLVVTLVQRVVEIDRQGQSVWNYGVEGRAWRARGR
jgi:outer membrane protein assembly factor BamB